MFDAHSNFGYSLVTVAPVPEASGTSLQVADASNYPVAPWNATVWPPGVQPLASNAEIVRVTAVVGNTLTIVRGQEGSTPVAIAVGFQIANTTSKIVFQTIENSIIQEIVAFGVTATASRVSFSNAVGGGIIFGGFGNTLTAYVQPKYFSDSLSTYAFDQTMEFRNSNGVTFGIDFPAANHLVLTASVNAGVGVGVGISAGGFSQSTGTVTFANSNGITFGLDALGVMTASHNGITLQSTQPVAASASNGSFLFSTLKFTDANGVSFGTSAGGFIFASVTSTNIGLSAGAQSNGVSAIVFSNANGVTFGLNGSTITASVNAAAGGSINFSVVGSSVNATNIVFSNSNGVTFGLNGSTITASVNTGAITYGSFFQNEPWVLTGTMFAINNTQSSLAQFQLGYPVSVNVIRFAGVFAASQILNRTSTIDSANASWDVYSTYFAIAYSLGTGASSQSLMSFAAGSAFWTIRNSLSVSASSNHSHFQTIIGQRGTDVTSSTFSYTQSSASYNFLSSGLLGSWTGTKFLDISFNNTLSAGPWWMMLGMQSSTSANSSAMFVNIVTNFNNTVSMLGVRNTTIITPEVMGSNATTGLQMMGQFFDSTAGTYTAFPLSGLSNFPLGARLVFQLLNT